jgi:hypothetical protein
MSDSSSLLFIIYEILNELLDPNISNVELEHVMDKFNINCRVIRYEELPENFDEILEGTCFIIFFGFPDQIGHWCAIWKDKDGYLHFFDPYGSPPDKQWPELINPYNEKPPPFYLSKFLHGKLWRYNPFNIQGYLIDRAIKPITKELAESSCGSLVILRLVLKNWSDKQFFNLIKQMPTKEIFFITKRWILS